MLVLDTNTTVGVDMAAPTTAPPGVMLAADVAEIFQEEARRQQKARHEKILRDARNRGATAERLALIEIQLAAEPPATITAKTVISYGKESRPPTDGRTYTGRYVNNPMPPPDGYLGAGRRVVWWSTNKEAALRFWFRSRKGQGHGEGGVRAGRSTADATAS